MKIHSGTTVGITGAFPIDLLGIADGKHPTFEGLDLREHPQLFGAKIANPPRRTSVAIISYKGGTVQPPARLLLN
jgi:hypothetical protein